MKILIISQHYYPEPFRITDICEELVKRGHEVSVITGLPNYPKGEIYPGYRDKSKREEEINGVKVHRCFTIGRKGGVVKRVLNYYSFALSSKAYAARLKEEFDVVLVNQLSPVMMAWAGIRYKKKHKKKLVLYCLDLWPESLIAGGIRRGSVIYKIFRKVSEKVYRQADTLLITSRMFRGYLEKEFGIPEEKISYLPQYAERLFTPEDCRKEPDGKIDLMFAGNIGAAQSVQTLLRAAKLTQDIENLYWHIVGDGSERERCEKLASELGLKRVTFYGKKPLEEMPAYYKKADAMLVSLMKDPVLSLTLPGKVQTYMAAGKPLICSADGETAEVVREADCGLCSGAENVELLAENVRKFCLDVGGDAKRKYSENSAEWYRKNFTGEIFFDGLEKALAERAT